MNQTLDAAGVSNEFVLAPGQSVDYTADTSDLGFASVFLEQSRNGIVWVAARGVNDVPVATLVGSGGSESVTAVLRNEGKDDLRFRAVVVHTGGEDPLAGEVAITFADRDDVVAEPSAVVETDNAVTVTKPLVAAQAGNVIVVPEHADNAAALAAGLPLGALYHTAGVVAAVIAEGE